jgi:hypothetical protein
MTWRTRTAETHCRYPMFTFGKGSGYPPAPRSGFSGRASAFESRVGHGVRTVGYGASGGLYDNPQT